MHIPIIILTIVVAPLVCCLLVWTYKKYAARKIEGKFHDENCEHFEKRVVDETVNGLSKKEIKDLEYRGQKEELDSDGETLW